MAKIATLLTVTLVGYGAAVQGASQGIAEEPAPPPDTSSSAPAPVHNINQARSGAYVTERHHSRIVWSISHSGYSTFSAMLPGVAGKLHFDADDVTRSRLDVTVDMNSVGSLIPPFDERLKGNQFFDTAKFPTSTFKSTKIEKTGTNTLRVTGDLTFMGVTRPTILEAVFRQAGTQLGYRMGFDGKMVIVRSDFNARRSNLLGDEVTLQIEAEFLLQE